MKNLVVNDRGVYEQETEIWKKRLSMMGWTDRFWTEYKRLRGDLDKEAENRELEEKWKEYEECT